MPKVQIRDTKGALSKYVEQTLRMLCEWRSIEILEMIVKEDHIHMILSIPPRLSVSKLMKMIKDKTAIKLFKSFLTLKKKLWQVGYLLNLFDDNWKSNVKKICQLTGQDITLKGLVEALKVRHAYFAERGAKASDHGLLEPYGLKISQKRAEEIFHQAYNKKEKYNLRSIEAKEFISYMMHRFCAMNQDKGMVTQIHYGAVRNTNEYLFKNWGADAGGDVSAENVNIVENLQPLLTRFFSGESDNQSHLILYPMNQTFAHTNVMLERAFPNVHSGFPWWHNDSPYVMEQYLLHTANSSLLTSSGGPVCDGRKILSEGSRFEVFDRIICRVIGKLVSEGQMSYNGRVESTKALMYENQVRLFNLKGEINE